MSTEAPKSSKKRKHDKAGKASSGGGESSGDFVIQPASETPKLDTSKCVNTDALLSFIF